MHLLWAYINVKWRQVRFFLFIHSTSRANCTFYFLPQLPIRRKLPRKTNEERKWVNFKKLTTIYGRCIEDPIENRSIGVFCTWNRNEREREKRSEIFSTWTKHKSRWMLNVEWLRLSRTPHTVWKVKFAFYVLHIKGKRFVFAIAYVFHSLGFLFPDR